MKLRQLIAANDSIPPPHAAEFKLPNSAISLQK